MSEPIKARFTATKRLLRYIKGAKDYGLLIRVEKDSKLVGYRDSEWCECIDNRKSTNGNVFQLSSKAISWSSKQQATILSSAQAKYIAVTIATCKAVWLRRILGDLC